MTKQEIKCFINSTKELIEYAQKPYTKVVRDKESIEGLLLFDRVYSYRYQAILRNEEKLKIAKQVDKNFILFI